MSLPLSSYQFPKKPQVWSLFHILSPWWICLFWAYTDYASVIAAVSSYVQTSSYVWLILFPCSHLPCLTLPVPHPTLTPEPWKQVLQNRCSSYDEHPIVSYSLNIDQLWVSGLITIYCKQILLWCGCELH